MSWLASIDMKDWLVVIATLLSPLIAVQVTKWLDRRNQAREEQIKIFKTLMATRGLRLDPRHVESLNLIDIVFSSERRTEAAIRNSWKEYLDHLSKFYPQDHWINKRDELYANLLHSMATHLRFKFNKVNIKNEAYLPQAYSTLEDENHAIRKGILDILDGKKNLPMYVVNLPIQNPDPSNSENPVRK
ncbi:MAG: hypothetical protein ING16_03115 [Roseomonas sp.]|nr:hypothetical protein [Roseomonas sp.]MCA3299602.1 hypothetical protein [Roseomonas sp.]